MNQSSMRLSASLIGKTAPVRVSPMMFMKRTTTMALPPLSPPAPAPPVGRVGVRSRRSRIVRCEVAVEESESSSSSMSETKIGARVRVKVPLKVYHVPKVPEVDLTGMEGEIKQYVALWKGKRISANYPYKVQFLTKDDTQGGGRGPVKFFAHLKEDEFEYL